MKFWSQDIVNWMKSIGVFEPLILLFVCVGFALAGPGGAGSGDIPVSAFTGGGDRASALLSTGQIVTFESSVGLAYAGVGEGAGLATLIGGFHAQRQAVLDGSILPNQLFRRGDVNDDEIFNIADGVAVLEYLFLAGEITCEDAGDSNDDGQLNLADAITVLEALFFGGPTPPAPGPDNCGLDPTDDDLECDSSSAC